MKKRHKIFIFAFLILCTQIGGFLGVYLVGKVEGLPFSFFELLTCSILGTIGGLGIFFSISYIRKRKRGNIPEIDERTALLFKRYFLIVLYVVMIGSSVLLIALYASGVETIEVGMLIVYMMLLFIFIGIGAFLTKWLC